MGLHVRPGTLNADTIQFDRSFGQGGTLYDQPPAPGGSQLPAGTVQVFGIDYALVARTVNLQPIDTRLVTIDPNGPHWPTVPGSWRNADWQDGNETQISGYQAPDGWVYIVATGSPAITPCGSITAMRRPSQTGTPGGPGKYKTAAQIGLGMWPRHLLAETSLAS